MAKFKDLIPKQFMPVQLTEKEVANWDDLERVRARRAPVLGQDDWWETCKYNLSMLLFCDCMSKAFLWVMIACGFLFYLEWESANHPSWEMGSLETWFVWGNAVGSLLHFAAKDEFKKVIAALCSRYGNGGGPKSDAGNQPVLEKK
jgi:hypothetical protein